MAKAVVLVFWLADLQESSSSPPGASPLDDKIRLPATSAAFIAGTLTDMICDSIESEKTKELIVSLLEEPAPLLTDLVTDLELRSAQNVTTLFESVPPSSSGCPEPGMVCF